MIALFASAKSRPLMVFDGNDVINDEVYRAVLDLPPEAQATPANARIVRARLLDFLHRRGPARQGDHPRRRRVPNAALQAGDHAALERLQPPAARAPARRAREEA